MKFNLWFIFLGVLLSITNHFSQNTYFIKYKETVPQTVIREKVDQKSLAPENIIGQIDKEIISLNFLAKGIAKNDKSLSKIIKVTFNEKLDEASIQEIKNSDPSIEYIQKSTIYKLDFVPNDSLLSEQWALNKIQAFEAWDKTQGADSILFAIIDTGLDYLHPDLQNKIFFNHGEIGLDNSGNDKRTNGIDDDNNGFVDDYQGWDFTDRVGFPFDSSGGDYLGWDNDPKDEQGHGTLISGIAAAQVNNVTGIAGVAPNIKMLNLRAFDPSGFGEEDDVAAAIIYAVQSGAKVINMSFGDNAFSLVLRDVIRFAYTQGVVLVGSSGNSGSTDPHYPSGYSEVISVGNSTLDDFVASSSNQ
jgi:subtilisin family serine protease